ncbi:hypothetical protein AGMMS49938_15260 [Fibrobacterales bacterium]|nr:hypothetical protein AGMMS49938_15260 [Fibrobacterales bacterium]
MSRGKPSPRLHMVARYPFLCVLLTLSIFSTNLFAQNQNDANVPISETQAMLQETTQNAVPNDSLATENSYNSDLTPQQRFEENPKHNIHEYDYKQQVIVGGVVMLCVALAMILNNNYNPKR